MKLKVSLQNIEIRNFRCFEELVVPLHPQLNVVIGINGVGKTALLEAIAGMLLPLVYRMRSEDAAKRIEGFGQRDIKNGRIEAAITLWGQLTTKGGKDGDNSQELSWSATLSKEGYAAESSKKRNLMALEKAVRDINRELRKNNLASLPVFVYYPCETADDSLARPNGADMDDTSFDIFTTYKNALNRRAFD